VVRCASRPVKNHAKPLIHTLDQDINTKGNSSDVNKSQPIDINSINLNDHASNDFRL
jgi:hypothetical protein